MDGDESVYFYPIYADEPITHVTNGLQYIS